MEDRPRVDSRSTTRYAVLTRGASGRPHEGGLATPFIRIDGRLDAPDHAAVVQVEDRADRVRNHAEAAAEEFIATRATPTWYSSRVLGRFRCERHAPARSQSGSCSRRAVQSEIPSSRGDRPPASGGASSPSTSAGLVARDRSDGSGKRRTLGSMTRHQKRSQTEAIS